MSGEISVSLRPFFEMLAFAHIPLAVNICVWPKLRGGSGECSCKA